MCGIAGVCNLTGEPVSVELLARITDVMVHRGPDGAGHYADGSVGLGNRRLAIIDLSPAGDQPMANEDGSVVVTFNGAIYNFRDLRKQLEAVGHCFRSHTDTEAIVHAYEEYGSACVQAFDGMFAFGLWDRSRRRLLLARDRYGVKPVYWYCRDNVFVFASEIKAILEHPAVRRGLCYEALNEYFSFQNIFSDLTLFDGVKILPAGCTLTIEPGANATPRIEQYWDYPCDEAVDVPEEAIGEELHRLFVEAVTRQLVADVPVGSYLSGGLDSGSIVAIAVKHLPRLTTFTGGFDLSSAQGLELGFDERAHAEHLANEYKTEHYEVVMHAGDMEWVLPELIWHMEDLRVGQSYPNYYVARLAGKFVKVVLSGAGGDELFAGYPWRYYRGPDDASKTDYLHGYYGFWQRLLGDADKKRLFNDETAARVGDHSAFDAFRGVLDGWKGPLTGPSEFLAASLYFEFKTFLHGLLVVEDKLSMAHSLETRVPFLDNTLVDFAVRIPGEYKLRPNGVVDRIDENVSGKRLLYGGKSHAGKAILRDALGSLLPKETTSRPKQGFSAPDASWFRGESIDYINGLLRDPSAMIYEFLRRDTVASLLDDHTSGKINRRLLIWSLLSFEWWCRCFLAGERHPNESLPRGFRLAT